MSNTTMATSTILLFLLAGLAAAHGDGDTTIRLPSDGAKASRSRPTKPWDCCDNIEISPLMIYPPLYRCNDEVKQCAAACNECVEAPGGAFVCSDWFSTVDPGPKCTAALDGPSMERPWKCCDNIKRLPTKPDPPQWRCNDELEPSQCTAACKSCREAPGPFPGKLICEDIYWGADPGPFCTPRPWGDCCDKAFCNKMNPPTCRCMDEVNKCAAACKDCQRVESSEPPRYVCKDRFTGQPGPMCKPRAQN